MLDENGHETTEEPGADETTSTGDEGTDVSTDTSSGEDQDGEESQDSEDSDSKEPILTAEEAALLEEFEDSTKKELNDIKSQQGRERKAAQQREAELLAVVEKLTEVVDKTQNGNTDTQDENAEPDLYTPTQTWENEDGTLNLDGMPEWNYRALQQHQAKLAAITKQLEDLDINVKDVQQTGQDVLEAEQWSKEFGISKEDFQNYRDIQKTQGEREAFKYLTIKRKQIEGQKAAAAYRDQQRGSTQPPPMSNGSPPQPARSNEDVVAAEVERIGKMEYGPTRTTELSTLFNRLPSDVARAVLAQVVQT